MDEPALGRFDTTRHMAQTVIPKHKEHIAWICIIKVSCDTCHEAGARRTT